jgi:BNR repeat-like domain
MDRAKVEHVVVFRDEGYFSAWPFNGGFWQFSDGELAVGFVRGRCDYAKPETVGHKQVDVEDGEHVILRSTDGGRTWPLDSLTTVYKRPEWDVAMRDVPRSTPAQVGNDASHPDFCLISGYGIPPDDLPDRAFVIVSTDRGHTWTDPVRTPTCGFAMLGGRPSYITRPDGMILLFCHGSRKKVLDAEGKHQFMSEERMAVPVVFGSWDGGASWGFLAEMEMEPAKPKGIMPYPLMLKNGRILAAVRRQYDGYNAYTQIYASDDGGRTWGFLSRVNDWGAPADLLQLPDDRIVCVYGYRQKPWGIRACVSADFGATWGDEITLRDDAGSWDVGYPRTLLRPDGSLITAYYTNDANDPVQCDGGVRYIAATIWEI